jgi:hypothetical protein
MPDSETLRKTTADVSASLNMTNRFCHDSIRTGALEPDEALHPGGELLLVGSADGVGSVDIAAVGFGAVLADLEFAFDAGDGDAEADDAGQHGAAESVGQIAPLLRVFLVVGFNESPEQRFFSCVVFDERERAAGVDGDVVPGGNGEFFGVERGADVAVRTGEDNEGFTVGEGMPVRIGFCEMAFEDAVGAIVFDDEGEMGRVVRAGVFCRAERANEDGEGVGLHGFDKDGAIGDLVEFGCVHGQFARSASLLFHLSHLSRGWMQRRSGDSVFPPITR